MTNEEYKKLSIQEFTKAAKMYEGDKAGIYKMCRKDYPDPQAFSILLRGACVRKGMRMHCVIRKQEK